MMEIVMVELNKDLPGIKAAQVTGPHRKFDDTQIDLKKGASGILVGHGSGELCIVEFEFGKNSTALVDVHTDHLTVL